MADVFISYSRQDTELIRCLFDALHARQREVWVDWQGIEYSTKWWEEICAGIEGADNFVLIISPDALLSVYCQREIEHARKLNKRIIPFLYRPIDEAALVGAFYADPEKRAYEMLARDNWEIIKAMHWIDYPKLQDFDRALDALLETVDTDLERVRTHTRLLLRIRDWESRGRSPSTLPRGDELAAYERWLAESDKDGGRPLPTVPQRYFIAESRRAKGDLWARDAQSERRNRQFRRAAAASALIGLLALIVGIGSANQALTARHDAATAEARERMANTQVFAGQTQIAQVTATLGAIEVEAQFGRDVGESWRLAGEANLILIKPDGNAEIAALLGIRALNKVYSPEADAALVKALDNLVLLRTFEGHTETVTSVAFAPDERTVLTGSWDGTARLWDAVTGDLLHKFEGHTGPVTSVAFSPNGSTVLTGSWDGTARLWEAATGGLLHTFIGHTGPVTSVAFAPDGRTVLTGSGDGTARLWDAIGNPLHIFVAESWVHDVAFAVDGQAVLTASDDRTARLWDVASGERLRTFTGHTGPVSSVVFAPDEQTVLTGSWDGTARLWEAATGERLRTFEGHAGPVTSVAFASDGRTVLTGSSDRTARLWGAASGDWLRTFTGHTRPVTSVAFSPDGQTVLTGSGDGTARLWDAATSYWLRTFEGGSWVYDVAFAPDGLTVLTSHANSTAWLWDATTGDPLRRFGGGGFGVSSVAFAPDGQTVLTSRWTDTALAGAYVELWDVTTGNLLRTFEGVSIGYGMAFAPDGKTVLTSSWDDTARLWDATTGNLLRRFEGHAGGVSDAAFAPDGKTALTGSWDGTARLWDVASSGQLRTFTGHTRPVTSVAFAPDGQTVLTGSEDGTARLWDVDYRDFVAYACPRVSRDLTSDERLRYGITDESPTCPQFTAP